LWIAKEKRMDLMKEASFHGLSNSLPTKRDKIGVPAVLMLVLLFVTYLVFQMFPPGAYSNPDPSVPGMGAPQSSRFIDGWWEGGVVLSDAVDISSRAGYSTQLIGVDTAIGKMKVSTSDAEVVSTESQWPPKGMQDIQAQNWVAGKVGIGTYRSIRSGDKEIYRTKTTTTDISWQPFSTGSATLFAWLDLNDSLHVVQFVRAGSVWKFDREVFEAS
jgi:hypothetical protein